MNRIEKLKRENLYLKRKNLYLKNKIKILKKEYSNIRNSSSWLITKPLRTIKIKLNNSNLIKVIYRIIRYRIFKIEKRNNNSIYFNYEISKSEREKEINKRFKKDIKVSILVPLYNTPINYLKEMIDSVKKQTYSNWELCLADGSNVNEDEIKRVCLEYTNNDKRIKYKKLEKNLGISENTNVSLDMSTGEYISLLDHDDVLHESALYETINAIIEKNADIIYTDEVIFKDNICKGYSPHFKPDYAPDNLRTNNYICHFLTFSRQLLNKVGKFRREFDGAQDYDLVLRLSENAKNIVHIPKILYYWRASETSVAKDISNKSYAIKAGQMAIIEHLNRINLHGKVGIINDTCLYKIKYNIIGNPMVSIIIPNYEHVKDLKKCIKSIKEKTTYNNYEILIVENNSKKRETFEYYKYLLNKEKNIRILRWNNEFNYAAINNYASKYAKGEYFILLNNDIEVITPNWIEEMLMFAQRKDVGAVGCLLYYPNKMVQHGGMSVDIVTGARHLQSGYKKGDIGDNAGLLITQNLSAVTGACMMVSRKKFDEVNGLDEKFEVDFNDIDFCMKLREKGYYNVFTPYLEIYHYESKSRGYKDTKEKKERFNKEKSRFIKKWFDELIKGDPFWNEKINNS